MTDYISRSIAIDLSSAHRDGVMTWQAAESLGCSLLIALGFADAHVTGSGADGGIDAVAADAVCQVKYWQDRVGRPEVQQLAGAAIGRTAVFLAASGYTPAAVAWADMAGVALFAFDPGGRVQPASEAADRLVIATGSVEPLTPVEQALSERLDRCSRWMAFLSDELVRAQRTSAKGFRASRRHARAVQDAHAAFESGAHAMMALSNVEYDAAPLARLDRELNGIEEQFTLAAWHLAVVLPS